MLIQIFNLLFPKLNLERDLITNCPGLELESSDYKPRTFDEEEVIRYITLMIKNAKESRQVQSANRKRNNRKISEI